MAFAPSGRAPRDSTPSPPTRRVREVHRVISAHQSRACSTTPPARDRAGRAPPQRAEDVEAPPLRRSGDAPAPVPALRLPQQQQPPPPPPPPPPPSRERPRGAAARPSSYALRVKLPLLALGAVRVSCSDEDGRGVTSADVKRDAATPPTLPPHVLAHQARESAGGSRPVSACGALPEHHRRWGIVRSVVLDTPRAKSIAAAIAAQCAAEAGAAPGAHKAGGAPPGFDPLLSDYGSGTPMRSLLFNFRSAKLAYIKKRLGGRWFKYDLEKNRNSFVLDPRRSARRTWDFILLFFVLFTAVSVPYDTCFAPPHSDQRGRFDHAIDAIFALDIALNFITGKVDKTGKLMNDPRVIFKKYLGGWFGMDVVATLPFEVMFASIAGDDESSTRLRLLGFLKTPRLLRLSRVLRLLDNMRGAGIMRIVRLVAVMCLITHWVACGLYLLAVLNADQPNWLDAELESLMLQPDEVSLFDRYTMAFNHAILVLVGNGFNTFSSSERMFNALTTLMGSIVQAAVIGNCAQVIAAMGATAARHQARADAVMETARYLGIPPAMQTRVADYFAFMSGCSHPGADGMARLAELSPPLHRDIMVHLYGEVIRGVPLFRGLPAGLIAACAARIRPRIFMAHESVFAAGELSREMYFLIHGTVEVRNAEGRRLTLLEDGAYFGELALLANVQRNASVITLTVCDICMFTSADLAAVLDDFPDAEPRMRQRALRRMAELQRETAAAAGGSAPGGAGGGDSGGGDADFDEDSTLLGLSPLLSGSLSARLTARNGGGSGVAPPPPLAPQPPSLAMRARRRGSLLAEAMAASTPRRAQSHALP